MAQSKKYIRLAADLQEDSVVDGVGLRTVIWTQGCTHHCKGCQNPQTWDLKGGGLVPISEVIKAIDEIKYQDGVTFSGGDPLLQVSACYEIAKHCKAKGLNIWVYTGFTYEELQKMMKEKPLYRKFLSLVDVLVDGRFILKERDLSLLFRGSRNQRLIDMPKTLEKDEIVLFNEKEYLQEDKFKKTDLYV